MDLRACELCEAKAAVFCPSDAAFLCWSCDAKVHEANFLVARHIRQPLCPNCNKLTDSGVSGVGLHTFATACVDDDLDSISSEGSSACISSTTSPVKERSGGRKDSHFDSASSVNDVKSRVRPRVDCCKADGIFVSWSRKLGVGGDVTVRTAYSALRVCLDRWKILPLRVRLAASMWLGLRLGAERGELTWQVLKRLEEISGVPAKVIVAAESKLGRALRAGRVQHRRQLEVEEGWAEC